jgi:hypothetical protein
MQWFFFLCHVQGGPNKLYFHCKNIKAILFILKKCCCITVKHILSSTSVRLIFFCCQVSEDGLEEMKHEDTILFSLLYWSASNHWFEEHPVRTLHVLQ